jgi:hypothetical protein
MDAPRDGRTIESLSICRTLSRPANTTEKEKYTCGIYHSCPEDCRHYLTSITEMVRDECEMIEAIDLENPKRALIKCDVLMSDSRPANH